MLTVAIRYADQGLYAPVGSKTKVAGFQLRPLSYQLLRALIPDRMQDIPRSRIVDYHYVTVERDLLVRNFHFLVPIAEHQLPHLEAITRQTYDVRGVYLWREGQWWSFPQLENYQTGKLLTQQVTVRALFGGQEEIRTYETPEWATRLRETYEPTPGPGFALTPEPAPADLPTVITGNGMVLEWKRGYEDKNPCWWLCDAVKVSKAQSATYRHYAVLKATPHARWSKHFASWYYVGGSLPPASWLALVGYTAGASPHPEPLPPVESPADRLARLRQELAEQQASAARQQPYHDFMAVLQLAQAFRETLHHLSQTKALPAMATPSLDDPWS